MPLIAFHSPVPPRRSLPGTLLRTAGVWMLLWLMMVAVPGQAQDGQPKLAEAQAELAQQVDELEAIRDQAVTVADGGQRLDLQRRAAAVAAAARTIADGLAAEQAVLQQRLDELGPVVDGMPEAADVRQQRQRLAADQAKVDSAVKRARLLALDANQSRESLAAAQVQAVSQELAERSASPLSAAFWTAAGAQAGSDAERLLAFIGSIGARPAGGYTARVVAVLGSALLIALLVLWPVRRWLHERGMRHAARNTTGAARLQRSVFAAWLLVTETALPVIALVVLAAALKRSGLVTDAGVPLLDAVRNTLGAAAYVVAAGYALLLVRVPAWRLLRLDTAAATIVRPLPWLFAAVLVTTALVMRVTTGAGLSVATVTAVEALLAVANVGALALGLMIVGRARAAQRSAAGAASESLRSVLVGIGLVFGWVGVVGMFIAALAGYLAFAIRISQWIVWGAAVTATLYLLMALVDDLCRGVLSGKARWGQSARARFGVPDRTLDQLGVVLSAVLRVVLIVFAFGALFVPFGTGFTSFFDLFKMFGEGVQIGGATLSVQAFARAVLVFFVVWALLRGVAHWLANSYLPTTSLEPDARSSVVTIVGYLGLAVAVVWALAALGIGMEKLAILISALSVGIGFGLQAITQNFVSGLILLVERPVRIGDWVRLGDQEGDIRRINVRSTEIQIGDRSTLIVPNSELITKTVQNMTKANPLGRVQLKFSVSLDEDLDAARGLLRETLLAQPGVRETPAPSVFVDAIDNGRVMFNCFAYVSGPREAYGIRSELLLGVIRRFREAGVGLGVPNQQVRVRLEKDDHDDEGQAAPTPR